MNAGTESALNAKPLYGLSKTTAIRANVPFVTLSLLLKRKCSSHLMVLLA